MSNTFGQPTSDNIRIVQVTQEAPGTPGSFPNTPGKVYKCLPCTIDFDEVEGSTPTITVCTNVDRAIYCANFRNNYIVLNAFYMVYLVNGKYVIDNQAAFLEAET